MCLCYRASIVQNRWRTSAKGMLFSLGFLRSWPGRTHLNHTLFRQQRTITAMDFLAVIWRRLSAMTTHLDPRLPVKSRASARLETCPRPCNLSAAEARVDSVLHLLWVRAESPSWFACRQRLHWRLTIRSKTGCNYRHDGNRPRQTSERRSRCPFAKSKKVWSVAT